MSEELKNMLAESLADVSLPGSRHQFICDLVQRIERTRPAQAVQVPEGMALVPVRATDEMLDDIEEALKDMGVDPELAGEIDKMALWMDALAATPAPVANEAVAQDDHSEHPLDMVAQGGGVDVEKVMALVRDYGDNCFVEGRDEVTSNRAFARGEQRRVFNELRAILASAPVATGWIPIETAPKDGTWVLLYGKEPWPERDDNLQSIVTGFWNADSQFGDGEWAFCYWDSDWRSTFKPTHWQPLPPAPSVDGEG